MALSAMGHGDGIVIADANFPAKRIAKGHTLVQLPAVGCLEVLKEVMKLIPPDALHQNAGYVMQIADGDKARLGGEPKVWQDYLKVVRAEHHSDVLGSIERQAFYEEATRCQVVVLTGDLTPYANIIVYKGVIENLE